MATTYSAYPVLKQFHAEYHKYNKRFVAGPPGSGKSVAGVIELIAIGCRQEPTPEGVRPTKFGIIRATYDNLKRTTLKTLLQWLPAKYVKVNMTPPYVVRCRLPLGDGTIADMEFELLATEREADLRKLDSWETTVIWLNEMTELPSTIVGKAGERTGRYPPSNMWDDGKSHVTYYGIFGDYNYPPKDHWIVPYLHEHENGLPEGVMLYEQPPALLEDVNPETGLVTYRINPDAENLVNLNGGIKYLEDLSTYQAMNQEDMVQTRLLCRYGRAGGTGKQVFTSFNLDRHVSEAKLEPLKLTDILVSIDTSGIHPCALFWQYHQSKWKITDGIYGDEMGLEEFIDDVMTPLVALRYPGCSINCICDPANARDSRTAVTPVDLLMEKGFSAQVASTNNFKARLNASEKVLNKQGIGELLISDHLTILIDALNGGYQYRKLSVVGAGEVFSTQPLKNKYSHWADAFQYGCLHIVGGGILNEEDLSLARRLANASYKRGRR